MEENKARLTLCLTLYHCVLDFLGQECLLSFHLCVRGTHEASFSCFSEVSGNGDRLFFAWNFFLLFGSVCRNCLCVCLCLCVCVCVCVYIGGSGLSVHKQIPNARFLSPAFIHVFAELEIHKRTKLLDPHFPPQTHTTTKTKYTCIPEVRW